MRIKEALLKAKFELKDKENEAVFILCELLKKDKTWLFLNENLEFDERAYFELIQRFKLGEPFEYIFEKADFYGLEFKVKKGVLIPRYDSEILLRQILKLCENYNFENILEIGFGSGILSIVLAKILGKKIIACDINKLALDLALENARIHGVESLIEFRLCDFRKINENFDFIFSNPPYIKNSYKLDIWVDSEPKNALFGGEKGYEILENIIEFAKAKKANFLACEFGYDQKENLKEILSKNAYNPIFFKDERGFDRAFVAKFDIKEKF